MWAELETGIGLSIVEWFNTGSGVLWYLLAPIAAARGEIGVMAVVGIVYWSVDESQGRRLGLLILGSQVMSTTLKFVFARPRPFHVAPERIQPYLRPEGFGIPSGHTIVGTVTGMWLMTSARRRWATIVGVVMILIVGLSRLIHGVHYPQDVLAGWAFGSLFFGVWYVIERKARHTLWTLRPPASVAIAVAGTAVLFALVLILIGDHDARKGMLTVVGALFGLVIGFILDHHLLQFSAGGTIGRRAIRFIVGIAILGAVHVGLGELYHAIVGEAISLGVLILYVVRYSLLGVLAVAGIPWLFLETRLAGRRQA